MRPNHILVATDFSLISRRAFEAGLAVAKITKARLTIAHVFASAAPMYAALPLAESREFRLNAERAKRKARRRLERMVALAAKARVRADSAFLEAEPVAGLLRLAKREKPDMIVLATHGRGGAAHLLLGSVAEKMVRSSPVPVLVARKTKWRGKGRALVAIDSSSQAVGVARRAARFANALQSPITVVHAIRDTQWVEDAAASAHPEEILWAIKSLGIDRAKEEVTRTLLKAGVRVSPSKVLIREGRPQDVIVREAGRGQTLCTIVGTHGRAGAARLILGSVAEAVVRHSPSPVLVLRSSG